MPTSSACHFAPDQIHHSAQLSVEFFHQGNWRVSGSSCCSLPGHLGSLHLRAVDDNRIQQSHRQRRQQGAMEQPDSSTRASRNSVEGQLGLLLLQEYYLLLILKHLVDDGLHECRRVCRQWYQVCNKLPVKLSLRQEQIPLAVEKFPNAVAVRSQAGVVSVEDEAISPSEPYGHCSIAPGLVRHLSRLNQLHSLDLCFYSENKKIEHDESLRLSDAYLQFCSRLRYLKVQLTFKREDQLCFCSNLRQLTSLTLLDVTRFFEELFIEPFTELQKIENLCTPCFLVNKAGHLMFPALTNLTHLHFEERSFRPNRDSRGVLGVKL